AAFETVEIPDGFFETDVEYTTPTVDPVWEKERVTRLRESLGRGRTFAPKSKAALPPQDLSKYGYISAAIPGMVVHSAGGAVPFEAEGTLVGHEFYLRVRSGYATLTLKEKRTPNQKE